MACAPEGKGMAQVARNLVDAFDGFLEDHSHIILKDRGVKPVRLPARSPNLNAHAERFVQTSKSECLSKIVPLSERHLRKAISEFILHYHLERNHQGIGNELIVPRMQPANENAPIQFSERLGGLLKHY